MLRDTAMVDYARRHPEGGLQAIEIPPSLSNEIEVREGDEPVIYRGEAFGVYFESTNIRGCASLSCVKVERHRVPITRRSHWWKPWVKELVGHKDREKRTTLWYVKTATRSKFFISDGEPKTDRTHDYTYRGSLVGQAANRGIILPDALLEAVFAPIVQELVRLSRRVAKA